MPNNSTCTVLWDLPKSKLNKEGTVLSFLSPITEHELLETGTVKEIVTMSRIMDDVSPEARELYLDLVADIGLYVLPDGRTLREALAYKSRSSLWWYHPVAFRNSEGDPTYTNILSLLAIVQEATKRGAKGLHLVKPPIGLAECLQSLFPVVVQNTTSPIDWFDLGRGLLGRIRWILRKILIQLALKRNYRRPQKKMDVVLQGFWDWSVFPAEGVEGQLSDRYFVNLPNELRKRGKSVGYWCDYDPSNRPGKKKRKNSEVLAPLKTRDDIILLESLLNPSDIVRTGLDFRPLLTFLAIHRLPSFVEVFVKDGLNFYTLFISPLFRGFISNTIPRCRLVENSVVRACQESEPKLLVCFQEHFLPSRAIYAGLRGSFSKSWAVQHASYNQGKTYGTLHQSKEFLSQPDHQSVPHPDRICVMGKNGERLFRGCGYSMNQVLLTGSTRYDDVRILRCNTCRPSMGPNHISPKKILIATSLPASTEFHLVQVAVEACKGLDKGVVLRLRTHPFGKMDRIPGYSKINNALEVSNVILDEDLQWADLILMSQSTVGEEAFLVGKPVWQFRFPHPDQSALAEVATIPKFYTVTELRQAFIDLASFSEISKPNQAEIEHVYRSLFQTNKEKPSVAIAEAIGKEFD